MLSWLSLVVEKFLFGSWKQDPEVVRYKHDRSWVNRILPLDTPEVDLNFSLASDTSVSSALDLFCCRIARIPM